MRKVLVFKETLLPPSETFILAPMMMMTRYKARLAGLERTRPSLPLPVDTLLLTEGSGRLARLRAKVYRRTGLAPLFARKAKRFGAGLVHAHFASGGRTALPLARSLGVPLVVTLHGADVTVRGKDKDVYKQLGEEAALFICVSDFIRKRALDAGFPEEKMVVHYIGVDCSLFTPLPFAEPARGVLFVGRLVEKKGCEYLLRAMQVVQRTKPDCELTVIGDGPLRSSLEALARDLQLRCTFAGVLPADAVRAALRTSRVFCAPSVTAENGDSEGLGMVFAEAQAFGVPVVSTQHGGIPEVVTHEVTGLLTPERDSEALADALLRLLGEEALWERFHGAAVEHIRRSFDLKTQTALLEDLYLKVDRS